MKANQKHSPKYWIVHNKNSDDVLIQTAAKSSEESLQKFIEEVMDEEHTEYDAALLKFYENEYEVILCSINNVQPFCSICKDTGEVFDDDELVWKCPEIDNPSHEYTKKTLDY